MTGFGPELKRWRGLRRMSQLELAQQAEVSTRHLSFLETGRSNPSRSMVLLLASALEVPLRDRNGLLSAAGFAPVYRETGLDDPELAQVRKALDFLLDRHEPYGAVVLDPQWNVLLHNAAHARAMTVLTGSAPEPGHNLLEAMFDRRRIRPAVVNFDEAGSLLLARVRRDARTDPGSEALLRRLLVLLDGDLPAPPEPAPSLLIPLHLRKDGLELRLFSTITTLGTPQDITLQELRIETFFPADDATDALLRSMASASPGASPSGTTAR